MKKIIFFQFAVVQSLISLAQPAFDDPCGALPLSVQSGSNCHPSNPISWTGATASSGIPAPGCGSYLTGDIWFLFITPPSGKVNIVTLAGTGPGAITDGAMAIYGSPGGCAGPFFFVVCNDDSLPPVLMPYLSLSGLVPGAVYFIRFWDYNDATSGNIGGICVTDPNPPLATTGAVGIGIQNPDNLLDVNGSLKLRGGNPGVNKVLTSDANGLASWVAPAAVFDPIPFKAIQSTDEVVGSGVNYTLSYNTEEYDPGSNFSSGTFSAPAAGIYHFDAAIVWSVSGLTSESLFAVMLLKSGSLEHAVNVRIPAGTTGLYSQLISADISLTLFQTVQVRVYQNSGSGQSVLGFGVVGKQTYFDGHRIK